MNLGDRLIESENSGIFIDVRHRFHQFVLDHPELLQAYRKDITPRAKVWLKDGEWRNAARNAWLTTPGLIANLQLSQTLIESAHFNAGARILRELSIHPDASKYAIEATRLSLTVAGYLDTTDSWELYQQWASIAQIESIDSNRPVQKPIRTGQSYDSIVWDAGRKSISLSLEGIVPDAMGKEPLTPVSQIDQIQNIERPRASGANITPTAWVAPVVSGNMLYTNDGVTVSGFDRFSLRPIWRISTSINADAEDIPKSADARARLGRIIEDSTTLTVDGKSLYVPTGIPRNGQRAADDRLLKINAQTGHIDWAIQLHQLDESLRESSIRGQVIVDQGNVIVGARTNNRKQRLISFSVVCLDGATGELLWIRHIASAGSLPFQQMGQLAHSPTLYNGVVYWTDHIGLGFAIESATGQVLWARPLPPPDLYARFSRPSYSNNTPAITEHGLFTLSTDGSEILQLNLQTGETIAKRQAEPVGEAYYLLPVGERLACISQSRVIYFPMNRFASATRTRSKILGDASGIRGRVVVANDKLIVPVKEGVEVLNPNRAQESEFIPLNNSGNIIALEGQLIVVDDMYASSFLAWDIASQILQERIAHDPTSAITLADLAYRARQSDQVVPTVESAFRVINKLPIEQRQSLKNMLFDVVLDMVEPSRHSQSSIRSEDVLDTNDQRDLLTLLGTIAQSHRQVVAHRMALGSWHNLRGNKSDSIRAYQDILDQPSLSSSMWEGAGIAVRGGLEATRRIRTILEETGYSPYRPFDKLASTEQTFINNDTDPKLYEQLAKRYPWATSTPEIWLNAAKLWKNLKQTSVSIHASNEGLDVAKALKDFGLSTNQLTIDRLAELAISGMIQTNRSMDAQVLATELSKEYPNLNLQIDGQSISSDQIAQRAKDAIQLPKIGDKFIRDDQPVLITGSPIKPATRVDQGGVVLFSPQLGRVEYVRAGRNIFESVWSRKSQTNETPVIPWQDETRTLILWPDGSNNDNTGTLEAIETTTGRVVWSISNVHTKLVENSTRVPDDLARVDAQFTTPTQGISPVNQLITVTDGHSIILSDRIGRAMGVDLYTGQHLWNVDLPANRVYDMDLRGGVLGICGVLIRDKTSKQNQGESVSISASIDPRTGESIQVLDRFGQLPRWIRVGNDGKLFVATTERLLAIDTSEGDIDWVINDEGIVETEAGWIFGDSIYVLDGNSDLWAFTLDEGTHPINPLDMREKVIGNGWMQASSDIRHFGIASARGYLAYDQDHHLIASDSINSNQRMIDVAWGLNRCVFVEDSINTGQESTAKLYLLDQENAQLLDTLNIVLPISLDRSPTSITPINGGVIVGYTEVSIFIRTMKSPSTS